MKHLSTSWKHIRRNPYQALAAIFIMLLTFLSISVFAFIVVGSSLVINHFESKPQVTAFFKEEASQADIDVLRSQIKNSEKVATMRYISKQDAVERYKHMTKNDPVLSDPLMLDFVSADILPASLEVSTNKLEDLGSVAETLKNSSLVDNVKYQKEIVSSFSQFTNVVRIIGIVFIVVLVLESIFIMMTVIGFKVSQKRDEIEIMKLLSATNWYIRWPFVLEGIFYGVVGTLIGWFIASLGLLYSSPYLETFLKGIPLFPVSPMFLFLLLGVELAISVILGIIASSLAVLRYLK